MKKINPLEVFLWTFRRNEKDVVNLYDSLSDLINFKQLQNSIKNITKSIGIKNNDTKNFNFLNSTATMLPFASESIDRVVALESAQHFKPLRNFISESYRILKKNGLLALAIPVMIEKHITPMMKLGLLSMTWSSEHYGIDFVTSLLKQEGFNDIDLQKIGSNVYEPLARYYIENRESIKPRISSQYPSYVEKILFKSLNKMKEVSQKKIIDYILITCQK